MAAGNNIVGEVGLKVVPVDPAAQFQAGVDQIIKRLEKQAQFQLRASGLEQVEQQANNAGQAFASAAIQAAGLTAAIFGIRAAVEGAIGKLSGLFDQLAQARAGFSSILKSEAAGGKLLDDIREFARVSPFVTQELVNYSQQLLGVGLASKEIIPLLKSTGDIISSVGGDTTNLGRVLFTLTQIKSIGALKGQDTMQLQNSLIPITKYLSEYLKKSSQEIIKLREDGKITADVVFAALNAQGEKVKGAMDLATRNIGGARAILSDTIIQLFQDQPVLNQIFEDVYKSIAKLAGRLGEEDFQQAFAQFFDGVNKVYEGLKPLLGELAKLADESLINGLQIFGSTIGFLGDVLQMIPLGVVEVLARVFFALATLKAPLLLISYVTSIKTMATAILPATTNLARLGVTAERTAAQINVNTVAAERNATATRAMAAASGQAGLFGGAGAGAGKGGVSGWLKGKAGAGILAGSVAASVAGGALSQSDNDAVGTAGGALQGAGLGASIGMLGGPWGAAAGALVGGAIGGITSFMARSEAAAKKHVEAMAKLGTEAAEQFIAKDAERFGTGVSEESFANKQKELTRLERAVQSAEVDLAEKTGQRSGRGGAFNSALTGDDRKKLEDQLLLDKAAIERLAPDIAAGYDPILVANEALVESLNKDQAAYKLFTDVLHSGHGRGVATASVDIEKIAASLKIYGFTLEELKTPEKTEEILQFINALDGQTRATAQAIIETKKYNDLLAAAKVTAAALADPEETKIQNQLESIKLTQQAEAAQQSLNSRSSEAEVLEAKLLALKQVELFTAERGAYYAKLGYDAATIEYRIRIEGEEEYQRLLGLRGTSGRDRGGVRKDAAPRDDVPNDFAFILGEQTKNREKAEAEAEEAAKLAKEAAEKAAADALAFAEKIKSSTESLVDRLEGAAENIATAAETWVHSIKERTQFETAISAGRAISNTQKQIKEVVELAAGVAELKARGLSDEAIKSLGIDNVSDLKQVRKLLKANPNDLTTLSAGVSELTQKSIDLATSQEDKRTQNNIAEGIIAAAETLGADFTKTDAAALAATFNFDTSSNPEEIAAAILAILSGGKINR